MTPVAATITRTHQPTPPVRPSVMAASEALATVSHLVVDLDLDDPDWREIGPALTAVVDVVRRSTTGSPSPIGPVDEVAPILRLRDLAAAAHRVAGTPGATVATGLIAEHLAALVAAAAR